MKALDAAEKMMKERGYVVIGIRPDGQSRHVGSVEYSFGARLLQRGHTLVVSDETNRADWDAQWNALLPEKAQDPPEEGQRFYRCWLATEQEVSVQQ
jgi:hypothetical protein